MPVTPARQATIREANLALLYRLILDAPAPTSRAALAAATGMTRATASALADALLAANLVAEVAPPPSTSAGRPAAGLVAAPTGPVGLGLEINVDYLAACVVDLAGTVRHTAARHADQRGRKISDVLAEVAELAHEVAAAGGRTVAGIAVAVPGLVETPSTRIRRAPNLGWQDVDIAAELCDLLPDTPFAPLVGNEADFAALAEAHAGSGSNAKPAAETHADSAAGAKAEAQAGSVVGAIPTAETHADFAALAEAQASSAAGAKPTAEPAAEPLTDFLYISGEIGVGAGIILNRELFRGARGWAGEIGHVTVAPDGAECRCGAHGCLETVAGLEALSRTGPEPAAAALGRAVAAAINLLDLPAVVLGGVYARPGLARVLIPGVARALAEHVVSAGWARVTVRASRFGEAAAAAGAATAVVRRIHADPAAWMSIASAPARSPGAAW